VVLPEDVKLENTTGPAEKAIAVQPEPDYPQGEFKINDTKVIYAKSGSSLLALAEQYEVPIKRLLDFNDLKEENVLAKGQLLYLQRKRKRGSQEFYTVQANETVYDISQLQGIRLENLLEYNHLSNGMQPAEGEKLYLKENAPGRPLLASEVKKTAPPASIVKTVSLENNYTTHVVQTKETLYAISKKYGVPVEKLMQWNNLDRYDLRTGQELIIYKN
ncbi:MAG: LysM peptidoglycan-binding domain-containing protein, partial [Chitinophagaceae bacterium]